MHNLSKTLIIQPAQITLETPILDDDVSDLGYKELQQPNIISQSDLFDSIEDNIDLLSDLPNKDHIIADTINAALDKDVNDPEINSIRKHQFNGGVLEFLGKYNTGNTELYPLGLVRADDPWLVANYILQNDLGE